jgi:hypothetical protein
VRGFEGLSREVIGGSTRAFEGIDGEL